jgi:hypothetical protein
MQNIIARTTHAPGESSENESVKPIAEIEGGFREFVQRDGGSSNAKVSSDTAANVESLAQRGTLLSELQTVIRELQQLQEFLDSEGERLEREISEYARLSKSTMSSARPIAENILRWRKSGANKP